MGKLTDLVNKGVRLIVANDETMESNASPPPPPQELPAEVSGAEPTPVERSQVAADVADFAPVYQEAGIEAPAHGYGVDKVGEMLDNKRFAALGREAKATAVLVALEAAGVAIRDVVQDAVLRDKALDAFEADKGRALAQAKTANDGRIQELNRQLEDLIQKINTEVQSLKQASEAAERAFAELQIRKRKEEERLHAVVAHFIEGGDNPITTGPVTSAPAPKPGTP
jgi:hypothetical protein